MELELLGPFLPYLMQDTVTDVDFNGRQLWITDLKWGRYVADNMNITEDFVDQFTHRLANEMELPFHQRSNLLEAETDELRISIVHESAAVSGRSVCIRKAAPKVRMTEASIGDTDFCSKEVLNLLINCVRAKMNFVFCGEPGSGKTECVKFFSGYIPAWERVITIEDNLELRYGQLHPEKDCVELKIDWEDFSYEKALKTCLRQNPQWIILSEARSREVKYLLECWSTGISGFTTLHTDDVRKIPDRILNMMEIGIDADRLENQVYEFVNLGILLRKRKGKNNREERYIDQICAFSREDGSNQCYLLVEDGKLVQEKLPEVLRRRLGRVGIEKPFQ